MEEGITFSNNNIYIDKDYGRYEEIIFRPKSTYSKDPIFKPTEIFRKLVELSYYSKEERRDKFVDWLINSIDERSPTTVVVTKRGAKVRKWKNIKEKVKKRCRELDYIKYNDHFTLSKKSQKYVPRYDYTDVVREPLFNIIIKLYNNTQSVKRWGQEDYLFAAIYTPVAIKDDEVEKVDNFKDFSISRMKDRYKYAISSGDLKFDTVIDSDEQTEYQKALYYKVDGTIHDGHIRDALVLAILFADANEYFEGWDK